MLGLSGNKPNKHIIYSVPAVVQKTTCNIQIIGHEIKLNFNDKTMAFDEVNTENRYQVYNFKRERFNTQFKTANDTQNG